jgi:hypothetical protein
VKPALGWTMLSRKEIQQVERSLAREDQDTRDEIGFLLIHQAFADRFFPGTSVLHTRIRYALFVPWLYHRAAFQRVRGTDLRSRIDHLQIELAIRLKLAEPVDVIGGDALGRLTSQPPDLVYWNALRQWRLVLSGIETRKDALRRLQAALSRARDDDGGHLLDDPTEVFVGLPNPPSNWEDGSSPLNFKLSKDERDVLKLYLEALTRIDLRPALIAKILNYREPLDKTTNLPDWLDDFADEEDKRALQVARDAGALAAIGRCVYGALLETLIEKDGFDDDHRFRDRLPAHFTEFGEAASRCDLDYIHRLIPTLPHYLMTVLRETQSYVRTDLPEDFVALQPWYEHAEVSRKGARRARLYLKGNGPHRRFEWQKDRHNTTALHYRWRVIRKMVSDLNARS